MKTLWTATNAAAATNGTATADFSADGVSIDTRTLKKGDIYVALQGEKLDGHDYVAQAFAAGAAAAVVSRKDIKADGPLLLVEDTMKALENLARAARDRATGKIVAVAGSVGKTGTKEMLNTLFSALGTTHASRKSFNNHWGVPLSLSNLPPDADFGIFEIGMNHPGEIIPLTQMVRPHIALVTTIDREHIEFFPNGLEGIADANAEVFEGMAPDGIAILNHDNAYFDRLKTAAEKRGIKTILGFGEEDGTDTHLTDCTLHADSSRVTASVMGQQVKYKLQIPGRHIVMNSLGALSVVRAAGRDLQKAVTALEKATPVEGRGNRYQIALAEGAPPVTVIDESYNANPASMQASFKVLELVEPVEGGRRIAVLGDMLELGKDGPRLHAELANPLLLAKTDLLFCCGPLMDALYQALPPDWRGGHEKDSKQLAEAVTAAVRPGDVVLIKGSAGSKMAYVLQALQDMGTGNAAQRGHRNAV